MSAGQPYAFGEDVIIFAVPPFFGVNAVAVVEVAVVFPATEVVVPGEFVVVGLEEQAANSNDKNITDNIMAAESFK